MRAVVQRVLKASVKVDGVEVSSIGPGLLILLGVGSDDEREDILWLSKKIVQLRIFDDAEGVMNRSVIDCGGDIMVVSQFTLLARTKKGNRPSYVGAAAPEYANKLYLEFVDEVEKLLGKEVGTGVFRAMMEVSLVNDGPVTIIIDSKQPDF